MTGVEAVASPELASCTGYLPGGIGWYRKDLDIPKVQNGNKVYIYFEGIYNNSEVFINGKWIGKRPNGYVSFMYELTPYLKFGGRNVLAGGESTILKMPIRGGIPGQASIGTFIWFMQIRFISDCGE